MFKQTRVLLFVVVAALGLSGCGGGSLGGGDGTTGGTTTGGTTTGGTTTGGTTTGGATTGGTTTVVSRVILLAETTQLLSNADGVPADAGEGIQLTARALDSGGRQIPNAEISFSVPPEDAALVEGATVNGTKQATLTTGSDPTPRTFTVTAISGGVSSSLQIDVVGTTLTLNGPVNAGTGQVVEYIFSLKDAGGRGIGGRQVSVTSTAGTLSTAAPVTDSSGNARVNLTVSRSGSISGSVLGISQSQSVAAQPDQFTVAVSSQNVSLGSSATITVRWLRDSDGDGDFETTETAGRLVSVSSTRGTLSSNSATLNASGVATFAIRSTDAGQADIVASSTQLSRPSARTSTEFVALVAADNVIEIQASPATVGVSRQSTVTAIVRDRNGNFVKGATVDFSVLGEFGGRVVDPAVVTDSEGRASTTFIAASTPSATDGVEIRGTVRGFSAVTHSDFITVTGTALNIALGTGNTLLEPNETTYDQPYSVVVTDSAGNPAPTDTDFRLSVIPTHYSKGQYVLVDTSNPPDGQADQWAILDSVECVNEDVDRNGVLDAGEDTNANGQLEPGGGVSVVDFTALDPATGSEQFNIRYPQDRNSWMRVDLRAIGAVAGTETIEVVNFTLRVLADDIKDPDIEPPGRLSPFGIWIGPTASQPECPSRPGIVNPCQCPD